MNLLLDTHILLWWWSDDPLLPALAREAIAHPENDVLLSAATVWEIAIKRAIGRLEVPDDLFEATDGEEFGELPITGAHALAAGGLPRHHDDPFDRMLIAQARAESLTLVTVDARFPQYEVQLLELG